MELAEIETAIWTIDNKLKEVTDPLQSVELLSNKRHLEFELKTINE